jgi:hypothetical protein
MKNINLKIAATLLVLCFLSSVQGASVLIPLQTCGVNPAANRDVVLTPVEALGTGEIPVMDKIQTNNASIRDMITIAQMEPRHSPLTRQKYIHD